MIYDHNLTTDWVGLLIELQVNMIQNVLLLQSQAAIMHLSQAVSTYYHCVSDGRMAADGSEWTRSVSSKFYTEHGIACTYINYDPIVLHVHVLQTLIQFSSYSEVSHTPTTVCCY